MNYLFVLKNKDYFLEKKSIGIAYYTLGIFYGIQNVKLLWKQNIAVLSYI